MTTQRGKTTPAANTGSFKGGTNTDPESVLVGTPAPIKPWERGPETYAEFAADVRPEHHGVAERHVMEQLGNMPQYRWEKVIGQFAATPENQARYYEYLRWVVSKSPKERAAVRRGAAQLAEQAAHVRAFDAGIPTEYDEYFEAMWAGDVDGRSEAATLRELDELQKLDIDFRAGNVRASSVIGVGYPDPDRAAQEWIDRQLVELPEQIRTRGRTNITNVNKARTLHREATESALHAGPSVA